VNTDTVTVTVKAQSWPICTELLTELEKAGYVDKRQTGAWRPSCWKCIAYFRCCADSFAAAQILGDHLLRMPDGETGVRTGWIGWQRAVFWNHPMLEKGAEEPGVYGSRRIVRLRSSAHAGHYPVDHRPELIFDPGDAVRIGADVASSSGRCRRPGWHWLSLC
jgi:hypothetical protein